MSAISSEISVQASTPSDHTGVHRNAQVFILALLILLGAIDGIWLHHISLSLNLKFLWRLAPAVAALSLLWAFYSFVRHVPQLATTSLTALELLVFAYVCGIFNYLIIGIGLPWRDNLFASWDRLLELDWPAYVTFIEHVPWLYTSLGYLYGSSIWQIAALTLLLGYYHRFRELTGFLGLIVFGGLATIAIGSLLPALGAYHYFDLPDHGRASYVAAIIGAHDRTLSELDPLHFEGLIVFPSYHTVLSIGIMIASWSLRYLRYPALIANLLLIAGVPVFGGHYFVDILGGAAVAALVVPIWRQVMGAIDAPRPATEHRVRPIPS